MSDQDVSILARPDGRAQQEEEADETEQKSVFQSSPALMDGRNFAVAAHVGDEEVVSILARPDGRAQLRRHRRVPLGTKGFNPRPP